MKVSGIQQKAARVSLVFDVVAWVIVGLGVLGVGLMGLSFVFALLGGGREADLIGVYLVSAVGIAVYAAVMWASVSLATIVAGYIANKQDELDRATTNMNNPW